jgi:mono/diheme cytochrome c family protein
MADAAKPEAKPAKYEPPKELDAKASVQKFMGRAKRQPVDQAEYFYNLRATHIVMFVSSALMLWSFVWMFKKDYVRDWKDYQGTYQALEFEKLFFDINALREAEKADQEPIRALDGKIEAFLARFRKPSPDAKGFPLKAAIFDPEADQKVPLLRERPDVHVVVDAEKKKLRIAERAEIEGEFYDRQMQSNFAKDKMGAVRFQFEEAHHHFQEARRTGGEAHERHYRHWEKEWERVNREVQEKKDAFEQIEKLKDFYEDLATLLESRPVPGVYEVVEEGEALTLEKLRERRARLTRDLEEKQARFEKEHPGIPKNRLRNLPMADMADPTLKVRQVILEEKDLKDQLNFTRIVKVDRCHTCHVGIANPGYEVTIDRTKEKEEERHTFKNPFLRSYVAHARGTAEARDCAICDEKGRREDEYKRKLPQPLVAHGAWDSDDQVRFTKALMAHPRLDLYVSDSSRHPLAKFGCTICHEGDGRDTDFTRVVHTPEDEVQANLWRKRHGTPYGEEHYNWNYRELWDLPMIQTKFLQSSCRRCHTDRVELDGAEKYAQGMKLFERAGCYGCHRTDTYQMLPKDKDPANPKSDPVRHARRPGPPLTRIAAKTTEDWAKKWLMDPRDFRPTTRMPQFFQLSNARKRVNKNEHGPAAIDETAAACIAEYIWSLSEKEDKDPDPPGLQGDAARGASVVAQVGCVACHKVEETTPQLYADQGKSRFLEEFAPSLSRIGSKVTSRKWLYHWVRNPKHHFKDSRMPRLRLTEQEAVDVVEYLVTLRKPEWEQKPAPQVNEKVLDDLILEQLSKGPVFEARAKLERLRRIEAGSEEQRDDKGQLKRNEKGEPLKLQDAKARRLWIGKKLVLNYGCYSCHELRQEHKDHWLEKEIPAEWANLEGIGVELTGAQPFGSKHWDRLDFGFAASDGVNHLGVTFKHGTTGKEIKASVAETRVHWLAAKLDNPRVFDGGKEESKPFDELLRMPLFAFSPQEIELLQTFVLGFTDHEVTGLVETAKHRLKPDGIALNRGERIVRDENCRACHRLALDRFEIEWERTVEGRKMSSNVWVEGAKRKDDFTPEQVAQLAGPWGIPKEAKLASYAWASDHRTLAHTGAVNPANLFVAEAGGEKWYLDTDPKGGKIRRRVKRHLPQDGGEILPHLRQYKIQLNRDYVKEREKLLDKIDESKPPQTALLEKELKEKFPVEKILDPNALGDFETRFPPMLRTQGVKTQADWLFRFLKSPWPIRPPLSPVQPGAKTLFDLGIRMPTFEFEDEEAASLVRWFAIRDLSVEHREVYPHTAIPEREPAFVAREKEAMTKAGKVVHDQNTGCAGCHYLRGQAPPGDPVKHAPDLADVQNRLRPRWLYDWVEEPLKIYPGTTMTMFDFKPLFQGAPDPQKAGVQAAVRYLLNLDTLSPKTVNPGK